MFDFGWYDATCITLGAIAFWAVTGYVFTSVALSACFCFAGCLLGEWLVDRLTR